MLLSDNRKYHCVEVVDYIKRTLPITHPEDEIRAIAQTEQYSFCPAVLSQCSSRNQFVRVYYERVRSETAPIMADGQYEI